MKKNKNLISPLHIEEFKQNSQSKYLKELKTRSLTLHNESSDFDFIYNNENLSVKSEIALWKAVVLQAAVDLKSQSKKNLAQTFRIKALMWFNMRNEEFVQVCNWAGFDPQYVIDRIKPIKEKAINFMSNNPMLIS